MADGQEQSTTETTSMKKPKTEVTTVKMKDGREVGFAGNRRLDKTTLIDETKIQVNGENILLTPGSVAVRMDFRNGETLTFVPPASLVAKLIGHGGEQKLGDEISGEKDLDDAVIAVQELIGRLSAGEWNVAREAGGFSGASVVIRAIMEASGQDQEKVKAFLQGKIDAAKGRGESLSRKALYDSFRNPNSKTGKIIERMEKEKLSKGAAVDADAALEELGQGSGQPAA